MKKRYIIFFIWLFIPFLVSAKTYNCNNINAQVSIEKNNLKINEIILINLISDDAVKVEYKASNDNIMVSNEGIVKAQKSGEANLSIYVENTFDYCTLDIPIKVLENDASLKELKIDGLDNFFNSDKFSYTINVPYNIDNINISGIANSPSAKITGLGKRYLNVGDNNYEIIVMAEDGTSKTYNIDVIRKDASSDATLKSLRIGDIKFYFEKEKYNYQVEVDDDIDSLEISAIPSDENSKIIGMGKYNLSTGKNFIYLTVISEYGNEQSYMIEINRKKGISSLKELSVDGYNLDKPFMSDEYNYTIDIYQDINNIKITAIPMDQESIVEILGNENFKYGENEIIINVKDKDKVSTSYKLLVNKIKVNKEEKAQNNILLTILFILFVISIIIMVTVCIIFIKVNYQSKFRIKRKRL